MFVIIEDSYSYYKLRLDNHDDYYYKGITFLYKNNHYFIKLDSLLFFEDDSKVKALELNRYSIKNDNNYYQINIYVYEDVDRYDEYVLYQKSDFIISDNPKADIVSKDPYMKDKYLILKDRRISSNLNVSVNGFRYDNGILGDGDIVEALGFRFIYNDDYLYINTFLTENKLKKLSYNEHLIQYTNARYNPFYYLPEKHEELLIDEIKPFVYNKTNTKSSFRNIISSLLMSVTMVTTGIINYINALWMDRDTLSTAVLLIMPIGMFLTGTILPLSFYLFDTNKDKKSFRQSKKEYLDYLDKCLSELKEKISVYINGINSHYFNPSERDKMFYASKTSEDFMLLSLGKTYISKTIEYPYCDDKDINEKIDSIKTVLDYIDDYPVYLDLRKTRINTIVCKKSMKQQFFYRFLLELAFKHHFDDIYLAVYMKDLSLCDKFYNLPHLFFNHNRLTLNSFRQLQWLDKQKFDRPVVLFMYDKDDYEFTNNQVYVISYVEDKNVRHKLSDLIVDYSGNNAVLYNEDKMIFDYVIHDVNYSDYFSYLGKYYKYTNGINDLRFKDLFNKKTIIENYVNKCSGLRADFASVNNNVFDFDLHESKQGPHGLIGGSTGSGKSELIISMLLSLCLRYPADYLNIVLIDYKGAGIEQSLSYDNKTIPHIVASVSNLDDMALERLIIRLNKECIYRQKCFNQLSDKLGTSIMNIDDYGNNLINDFPKIGHLLIVVDEFAQLKKESPETIKDLISISRIGRSLGIHLILATQKPSGNIDNEIWSNSRFKISLKVFEEKDSLDLINDKAAAYLSKPGQFLMRIDDNIFKAHAIYGKKDINDKEPYSVSVLDNKLDTVKTYSVKQSHNMSEVTYFCKSIISISEDLSIKAEKLTYEKPLPQPRKKLEKRYHLGIVDDYLNCETYDLSFDISSDMLICSSRIKEINSTINCLNENSRRTVLISTNNYSGGYICDYIHYDQISDIRFLFESLLNKDEELTVLIEDLSVFLSYDETLLDDLCRLLKRSHNASYNVIALNKDSNLVFKIINNFENKVIIDTKDVSEATYLFSNKPRYSGNSFCFIDEPISFIENKIEEREISDYMSEPYMRYIPDVIYPTYSDNRCLIGYSIDDRNPVYYEDRLIIISYSKYLLDKYEEYYKDRFIYVNYENNKDNSYRNENMLWLGSGIYSQRIFNISLTKDIGDDMGILICGKKKKIIRTIDDVQDND